MKTADFKIKKNITARVSATQDHVTIKFPKQSLGVIAINFVTPTGEVKQIKSFELWITDGGDKIKAESL